MVLLKFNFTKLNTSKATLFTQLNKSFWKSGKYLIVAQGASSIYLNNSYQIHCVKCPWFWVAFVPYATWAVFCTMDETLDVRLPPLLAISNSARKGISSLKKKFQLLPKSYKILFNPKWIWSCVSHTQCDCL